MAYVLKIKAPNGKWASPFTAETWEEAQARAKELRGFYPAVKIVKIRPESAATTPNRP